MTKKIISSLLIILTSILTCFFISGIYTKYFMPRSGIGWDQIADSLGVLLIACIIGLVLGIILTLLLEVKQRFFVSGLLFIISIAVVMFLQSTYVPKELTPVVTPKQNFQPWYKASIRITHTKEVLDATAKEKRPIPFTFAEVFTAVPEFNYTNWTPDYKACKVKPSEKDLQDLLVHIYAAHKEGKAGSCLNQEKNDLGISFTISMESGRTSGTVKASCLKQRKHLLALVFAFENLGNRLCNNDTAP